MMEYAFSISERFDEISALKETWHRLRGDDGGAGLETDFSYYLFKIQQHESQKPLIVTGKMPGTADASVLVVGWIQQVRFVPSLGYFKLNLLGSLRRCLRIVRHGVLGQVTEPWSRALVDFLVFLMRERHIDYVYFELMPAECALAKQLRRVQSPIIKDHTPSIESHYAMLVPENIQQFWKSRDAKSRYNLKRTMRNIDERFANQVEVKCFRTDSDLSRFCSDAERIAKNSHLRALKVSFKDTPSLRIRKQFEAQQGWFRSYILYLGLQAAAFISGTLYQGVYFTESIGFDNRFQDLSVGTYLLLRVFEQVCEGGEVRAIDFGFGADSYKKRFATAIQEELRIHLFSRSFSGAALNAASCITAAGTALLRNIAKNIGLYQKMRSLVRKQLSRREGWTSN